MKTNLIPGESEKNLFKDRFPIFLGKIFAVFGDFDPPKYKGSAT